MREQILEFLKLLEQELPPASGAHHAITFAQYGSDATGWEDVLALQISFGGLFHCFFLESGDLERGADLIQQIANSLRVPFPGAQTSSEPFRYI